MRTIGVWAVWAATATAGDGDGWRMPRALRPGDTVAFVAPAAPADMSAVRAVAGRFEKLGYRVQIPPGLEGRKSGYLSGDDDTRAAELNAAFRDSKVRAIVPVRGGFGLTRILDRLDYAALRADPPVVLGYSDLTALHLAIARKARVVTFHSPMPLRDLWDDLAPTRAFAGLSLRRAIFADQYPAGQSGYAVATPKEAKPETLVAGFARGRLVGGNLSLICATLGTPYALEPRGAILFVEDVNEAPYRVDRMLSQLRLAGVLDAVAGVVVGSFSSKEPGDAERTDAVLRGYFGALKVPVVWRFPVGHTPLNATLPHGAWAELDATRRELRLLENPVRLAE